MRSHKLDWYESLRALFGFSRQSRKKRRPFLLALECLEDRTAPADFNPLAATVDGDPGSLRANIITANFNPDATNTFHLELGTYNLTIANLGGNQENLAGEGDLDLFSPVLPTKTYIFEGNGATINQTQFDRVFQIIAGRTNGGVIVQFQNLTITGGQAVDDGLAGSTAGTTDALGGGILNLDPVYHTGGDVSFTTATITDNAATAGAGGNGGVGAPGGNGRNAIGGGLYSQGGTLTISASSFTDNQALGGAGGNGGNGANGGTGGNGGNGGDARGGGLWVQTGYVTVTNSSTVINNTARAGAGGNGGNGANDVLTGGNGGAGGNGGSAQGGGLWVSAGDVTLDFASSVQNNLAVGEQGGLGGQGGTGEYFGGNGGAGGNGGSAQGAGIWVETGNVTVSNSSTVTNNTATAGGGRNGAAGQAAAGGAGNGGQGGAGGNGGSAQGGGIWLETGNVTVTAASAVTNNNAGSGSGGDGGSGAQNATGNSSGNGGAGGPGGAGADAQGGGIWANAGTVTVDVSSSVTGNVASAGAGNSGGAGGNGGTFTGNGGIGGAGGNGGNAQGGGIWANAGNVLIDNLSTVDLNNAIAGAGSDAGDGGNGATRGGAGGAGGVGGAAQGGGVWVQSGNVTLDHSSSANSNQAVAGAAGNGGGGGLGKFRGGLGGGAGAGGTAQGGGVWVQSGNVTIQDGSSVDQNQATGSGGGHGGQGGSITGAIGHGGDGGSGGNGGAAQGGGIFVANGAATIDGSTVNSNAASAGAGGHAGDGEGGTGGGGTTGGNGGRGGNGGLTQGGGLYLATGNLTLDKASVNNTVASPAPGGNGGNGGNVSTFGGVGGAGGNGGDIQGVGIWVGSGAVTVDIADSTIALNSAAVAGAGGSGGAGGAGTSPGPGGTGGNGGSIQGGGLFILSGIATISNSTISSNTLPSGGIGGPGGPTGTAGVSGVSHGGGIFVAGGTVNVGNSTIAFNTSANEGGGLFQNAGTVSLRNTIVSDNTGTGGPDLFGLIDAVFSLIEDTTGATFTGTSANNLTGLDPMLAALANNGGPTLTHLPALTSPVIDAGDPNFTPPPTTDQRGAGFPRLHGRLDIGALEVAAKPTITSANAATFLLGVAGSFTITTTGFPTPSLSIIGTLPGGVTFTDNGNGTATLAGIPTGSGAFPLTITAGNGTTPDATQLFTLTVSAFRLIRVSPAKQAGTLGTTSNFTVKVVALNGQPLANLANVSVTFQAPASGPTGTFSNGQPSITLFISSNGFATVPFTRNFQVGFNYRLTARVGTQIVQFLVSNLFSRMTRL